MGTVYYQASSSPIHVEDRVLAHLKVVITTKLRRGESFTLSWPHSADKPGAASTIWLNAAIPLRFEFDNPEQPELNRDYLTELAVAANSSSGIRLTAEDVHPCARPARSSRGDRKVREVAAK